MKWITKIKPGVNKPWLQALAGVIWSGVGIYLISLGISWINRGLLDHSEYYITSGVILAAGIYWFGFSRLAKKNSQRINGLEAEKPCLFAFQEWHSYPLVLFMIGLGITLREYSPIPKPLLGILYIGIGGGLASASLHYYFNIIKAGKSTEADKISNL
jgi:hypothetical protein